MKRKEKKKKKRKEKKKEYASHFLSLGAEAAWKMLPLRQKKRISHFCVSCESVTK
jgi:hypothetical protein